ncbi:hypothetical protein [Salinibacter grassmerensis]|uniref:hypothetical protein n=1 Tax=Salinibacter grassmerensis TaxID=3040353 RepID=UPI0021E6ECD7|nr:hypothetical protein [Salinibacter grassmerensis]
MHSLLHLNAPRLLIGAFLSAVFLSAASPAVAQRSFLANPYLTSPSLENSSPVGPSLTARGIAFELRHGSPGARLPPPRQAGTGDKTLHALVSMGIVIGAYYGSREVVGWPHRTSLMAAGGSALAAGLLKELYDRSKIGNRFSRADMVFNAVGTGVGIGVVVGLRGS